MKVFITKYALTRGIVEMEVEAVPDRYHMIVASRHRYFHKPDWYASIEEAQERAKTMAVAKLKRFQKMTDKLNQISVSGCKVVADPYP